MLEHDVIEQDKAGMGTEPISSPDTVSWSPEQVELLRVRTCIRAGTVCITSTATPPASMNAGQASAPIDTV